MASDPTTPPNSSADSDATQASPTPTLPVSLPDPISWNPFQSSPSPPSVTAPDPAGADSSSQASTDAGTASASPTDTSPSLPDPFASDPFQTSPSTTPASGTMSTPQTGVWFNNLDPQFLIQWSLQEVHDPQLAAQASSQAAPPATCKACVRIFQEVFQTTLAATRPVVPFSLRDAVSPFPYLQGSLVLLQQPSNPPVLLVKNLKFSGFQQAQVVLFPSLMDTPGGESGAKGGAGVPAGSGNESGG